MISSLVSGNLTTFDICSPPSVQGTEGELTRSCGAAPAWLPVRPHPACAEPSCPGRQVGEGVSPLLMQVEKYSRREKPRNRFSRIAAGLCRVVASLSQAHRLSRARHHPRAVIAAQQSVAAPRSASSRPWRYFSLLMASRRSHAHPACRPRWSPSSSCGCVLSQLMVGSATPATSAPW